MPINQQEMSTYYLQLYTGINYLFNEQVLINHQSTIKTSAQDHWAVETTKYDMISVPVVAN